MNPGAPFPATRSGGRDGGNQAKVSRRAINKYLGYFVWLPPGVSDLLVDLFVVSALGIVVVDVIRQAKSKRVRDDYDVIEPRRVTGVS